MCIIIGMRYIKKNKDIIIYLICHKQAPGTEIRYLVQINVTTTHQIKN